MHCRLNVVDRGENETHALPTYEFVYLPTTVKQKRNKMLLENHNAQPRYVL